MNCKEGDLAIVVRSSCGNEGKIVRCLKLHPPGFDGFWPFVGTIWETDNYSMGGILFPCVSRTPPSNTIADSQLRPIRDTPGEDETLMWAPKKEPVPA